MREAIANAQVGDDVYGEDPTVNALEARVASMLGKEQALFVPTGTMANLCAVMAWCGVRVAEVILGDKCPMYLYEQGGAAQIAGVSLRPVLTQEDGQLTLDDIEAAIRPDNDHFPTTSLIALENTHNYCGGRVLPSLYVDQVAALAATHGPYIYRTARLLAPHLPCVGLPLHVDGARLWNAAESLQEPLAAMVRGAASVSVCLSKGLGCPAGSLLAGPADMIRRAR